MKRFFWAMIPITLFFFGVFALAKSVRFKPWTKPGQEEQYKEFRQVLAIPDPSPNAESLPEFQCDHDDFDFGSMPLGMQGEYVFTFRNNGQAPLVLRGASPSCSCMEADLTAAVVEPGSSKDITVSWRTEKFGAFAQFVKVTTNSPKQREIDLWVRGNVATILSSSRLALGFGDLVPNESRTQDFFLFSETWKNIAVDRVETSSEITCEMLTTPAETEITKLETKQESGPIPTARVDFRLSVKPRNESGTVKGFVRIYVRPPQGTFNSAGEPATANELMGLRSAIQPDKTVMIDLPVETVVKRRFSLYSPIITNADKNLIDLGKLTTKTSKGKKWVMIARVRGGVEPTDVRATLTGIPNIATSVEKVEVKTENDFTGSSYRIRLEVTEPMQPAVYDFLRQGKLRIDTPGLPGEESLEFFVELDIMPDK